MLNPLEELKSKFPYDGFVIRPLELTYTDYFFYKNETLKLSDNARLFSIRFTGKQLKQLLSTDHADEVEDDQSFVYLPSDVDNQLRRNFENIFIKAASFKDRSLHLINSWSGLHLKNRDVHDAILAGSARMFEHPNLLKAIKILQGSNFKWMNKFRNIFTHSDHPSFDVNNQDVVATVASPQNIFKNILKKPIKEVLKDLAPLEADMNQVLLLLNQGIDDLRSKLSE